MPRSSSGTYTLPASVNPVTTATTITSSWANTTLPDIAAEITDSLSRSGEGAMLAPLRATDGSASAPAVTFDADQNTGLYRAGADDLRVVAGGVQALQAVTSAGVASLTLGGSITNGATVTQSTANTAALTATGNGTGAGVAATGGATSGAGVTGTGGAPNGRGGVFTGTGTAEGVYTTGVYGIIATGTASEGIAAIGAAGVAGGRFSNGTNATPAVPQTAATLVNGNLKLEGANPTIDVGFTNTLTPTNVPKAWGLFRVEAGVYAVLSGFNITSIAAVNATDVRITFASAFANTNYAPFLGGYTVGLSNANPYWYGETTTTLDVRFISASTGATVNMAAQTGNFSLQIFGAQ